MEPSREEILAIMVAREYASAQQPVLWKVDGGAYSTHQLRLFQFRAKTIEGAWYSIYKYMLANVTRIVVRHIDGQKYTF